jgi:ATP-dependent Clp protease protease subunit
LLTVGTGLADTHELAEGHPGRPGVRRRMVGSTRDFVHTCPPRNPRVSIQYQRTREMTVDELLLENRVVFLIGEITPASAARVTMQMLYLENQKKSQDIHFYINSPGGVVDDTLAIYDTMRFLSSPVNTYCIGRAYSGAALLLTAGEKGKRFMLPHAKVMIHQPYGGVGGQAEDIKIQAEQIIKTKAELIRVIARHTGQSEDRVRADSERDRYFTAEEAKAYGLVDEIISEPANKK